MILQTKLQAQKKTNLQTNWVFGSSESKMKKLFRSQVSESAQEEKQNRDWAVIGFETSEFKKTARI